MWQSFVYGVRICESDTPGHIILAAHILIYQLQLLKVVLHRPFNLD